MSESTRQETEQGEDPAVEAAFAAFTALDGQLDDLLESTPERDRAAAAAGVYVDGDGRVRTRHGMLRSVEQ